MTRLTGVESPSLAEQIRESVVRGELSLPPLPEVATRLLSLLGDENGADPKRVAVLIQNDPAIAASVLRMANSACFGGLQDVSDLAEGIARLGLRQVGTLVTAIAHQGNFSSADPARMKVLHELWDHAVASALIARALAARDGSDEAEAYLAGLLHDTGKLLVLRGVDHLEERAGGKERLTSSVVEELMDLLHAELGYAALASWKIPEPVCRVALHHHDEDPQDDPLLLHVQAADAIAGALGSPGPSASVTGLLDIPAVERLNLGDLELAALVVDVEDEIAKVRSLF